MSKLNEIREMVQRFPVPGSAEHDELTKSIKKAGYTGTFCQDTAGYWGEASDLRTCHSKWVSSPGGWMCDANAPKRTGFVGGGMVRQKRRVAVIPPGGPKGGQVIGKTGPQYVAEGWQNKVYNGHEFYIKDEWWCQQAIDEGAFYCHQTNRYYCKLAGNFGDVLIDGRTYCFEEAELFYWDRDDRFHLEPQPARAPAPGRGDPGDGNVLPDYHSTPRAWKKERPKALLFGCEVEILCNISRMDVLKMAQKLDLIGERDGSIDQKAGIEIVGKPGTLEWHADPNQSWMKFLALMTEKHDGTNPRAKGWDAGEGYGMHVSINRLAIPTVQQAKMIKFVNDNATLCERIAGRTGRERVAAYKIKDIQDITHELTRNNSEKYEALAIRDEQRLEMRIFRSTLDKTGFLRNIEFCAAIVDFTRDRPVKELKQECFIEWLKTERKTGTRESSYPNLSKRLVPPAITKVRKASS